MSFYTLGGLNQGMTAFSWVLVVLVIVAIAAITGIKPSGTKPVARTRLMAVARVVLVLLALAIAYFAWR